MIIYDRGDRQKLIYDMWEANFHDPVPYADFYFENVYGRNQVLLLEEEEAVKGMLHWNPYSMRMKKEDVEANYIVGVATQEEFRRQGVMRKLLEETFLRLREKGQPFTYLMPADENYYLPFDFRFGMRQFDQELEVCQVQSAKETPWEIVSEPKEKEDIAQTENEVRDQLYDIHTKVSADYLNRLEKEAKSDFARMLYVYAEGQYQGRFVVGAEDNYMSLSQISCVNLERKKEFIEQILAYCENRYHFGYYRLILDESWSDVLNKLREEKKYRMMPTKSVPIIMFRILNLEELGKMICFHKKQTVKIFIRDRWLPCQEGYYLWEGDQTGSKIKFVSQEKMDKTILDAGEISIGDLTNLIFGNIQNKNISEYETLTSMGREWMEQIIPLNHNCIMEIV